MVYWKRARNFARIDGNLCKRVNNLQLELKAILCYQIFLPPGAAQEGLRSPSCPVNDRDNSQIHFPFSHSLSELSDLFSNEDKRDRNGSMSLP